MLWAQPSAMFGPAYLPTDVAAALHKWGELPGVRSHTVPLATMIFRPLSCKHHEQHVAASQALWLHTAHSVEKLYVPNWSSNTLLVAASLSSQYQLDCSSTTGQQPLHTPCPFNTSALVMRAAEKQCQTGSCPVGFSLQQAAEREEKNEIITPGWTVSHTPASCRAWQWQQHPPWSGQGTMSRLEVCSHQELHQSCMHVAQHKVIRPRTWSSTPQQHNELKSAASTAQASTVEVQQL